MFMRDWSWKKFRKHCHSTYESARDDMEPSAARTRTGSLYYDMTWDIAPCGLRREKCEMYDGVHYPCEFYIAHDGSGIRCMPDPEVSLHRPTPELVERERREIIQCFVNDLSRIVAALSSGAGTAAGRTGDR